MQTLKGLEPERVFYWFEEICRIPHGSGNTLAISNFLVDFAENQNLKYVQDDLNNVVIFKQGSEGYENVAPVILQGHMDMVCEKTPDSDHDFMTDPLDLYVEDGFVRARNTTLGGDDGIYVAMALAVLEDETLQHPPIEAIFTVDEETGLLGAEGLDCSVLKGHRMINLDSEADGVFWVASAGGISVHSAIPVKRAEGEGVRAEILIDGLKGGHSGAEIDKGRASAVILMGRLLYGLSEKADYGIIDIYGGEKENAIPKSCRANVILAEDSVNDAKEYLKQLESDLRNEYLGTDDDITVSIATFEKCDAKILHPTSQSKIIFFLRNIPWAIQKMSGSVEGLVETSNNLGIVRLTEDEFTGDSGVRSSVGSAKYDIADKIRHLTEFLGGEYTQDSDYPAWEYRAESPLRDLAVKVYTELTGEEPLVTAVHAGLECGLFYGKIADLDCISLGPNIFDIHTVDEHLDIASTEKTYRLLQNVLRGMKE